MTKHMCKMAVLFPSLVVSQAVETAGEGQTRNISLPMDLLIQPLRKRFQYHFYGKRQTNNLEKVRQCN